MSTRARVLLLAKGLGLGGMERLLAESIPHLDRDRFDYEIGYFLPWKDDLVPTFEDAGLAVHCLEVANDFDVTALSRLRSLLRDRGADLVHTHSPHPAAVARLAARGTGVRALVHTEHSLPRSQRLPTRLANRLTYPLNDLTIAVSDEVASAIDSGWLGRPRRLRVIHGGLDLGRLDAVPSSEIQEARGSLGIPPEDQVVGNVAHLRSQKGLEVFLQAAGRIASVRPDTSFVLVGREKQPGIRQGLEDLAVSLGIGNRVHFAGFQPDPRPFLASFDVFMMSSHYEGFPIALIEAMAMGKAVVTTRVGGVPEAVTDQVDGMLVEPDRPEHLAEVTLRLLDDPEERARLGEQARATATSRFSIEAMVRQVEASYEELLG